MGAEAGSDDGTENEEESGRHFCLGPVRMPLAPLMNITSCLEPDDLTPVAAACKSFCIPININLQYIYFLVRLLRLILLGPEVARMMREQESDGDSTSASSDND